MYARISQFKFNRSISALWSLSILWFLLNFIDIIISWVAIRAGAIEVGFIYQFSESYGTGSVIKVLIVTLLAVYMIRGRKVKLLIVANGIVLTVIIWNAFVLSQLV